MNKTLTINFTKIGKVLWTCIIGLFLLFRVLVMFILTGVGIIFIGARWPNDTWLWVIGLIILSVNATDWWIGSTNFWKKHG